MVFLRDLNFGGPSNIMCFTIRRIDLAQLYKLGETMRRVVSWICADCGYTHDVPVDRCHECGYWQILEERSGETNYIKGV